MELACTVMYFVYVLSITEEASLKLLRERFKHFIRTGPLPANSGYESKIRVQGLKKHNTKSTKNSYKVLKSTAETSLEPFFSMYKSAMIWKPSGPQRFRNKWNNPAGTLSGCNSSCSPAEPWNSRPWNCQTRLGTSCHGQCHSNLQDGEGWMYRRRNVIPGGMEKTFFGRPNLIFLNKF